MATSSTLNLANYTTVWDDNFATDKSFDWTHWNDFWGNVADLKLANGALTISSSAAEGWAPMGFMQAPTGPSAGQGYGLYSVTASADAGQGVGICIVMWPADNNWPGAEIDLVESWDKSAHVQTTIHWAGAGNSNQQDIHQESLDISVPHTYAMDWEAGSLTFYVDGVMAFTTTSNVPKDYAHGGINETFGAEVTNAGWDGVSSKVSLHLYDMNYAKLTGSSPAPATAPTPVATHPPATLAAGSGSDQLVLKLSEDAYNGDAQYTVKVDGVQVGGTFTASALHGSGDDTLTLSGNWGTAAHTVTVNFLNDAYGGTAATDRNLYVDGVSYDGTAQSGGSASLLSAGPVNIGVAASGSSPSSTLPTPSNGGITVLGTASLTQLHGTAGNDVLVAGPGNDGMTGGAGADSFVLPPRSGHVWINDFTAGTDHLVLQGVDKSTFSSNLTTFSGSGGLDIHFGTSGDEVFLSGVWKLGASDVVFA